MLKYWDFKDYVSYPYPILEGYKVCAQSHSYTKKNIGDEHVLPILLFWKIFRQQPTKILGALS